MKKCSYCGAEYPDDAVVCAVDQTPFTVEPPAAFSKWKIFLWPAVISALALYFLVFLPFRGHDGHEEIKRRAELHLLNAIQGRVGSSLDLGGQLPTNWLSLSNVVDWNLIVEICEHYQLPPPTELYTVLKHPIDLDPYHRSVFLVRSEARGWPAQVRGRWVVGVCFFDGDSNRVDRSWFPEKDLPPEVRLQLPTGVKKPLRKSAATNRIDLWKVPH